MTKIYITTKIVRAERRRDIDGRAGYRVLYPDGYVSWCPEKEFERTSRELSDADMDLIDKPYVVGED